MAKKQPRKLSPGECVRSLQAYNEAVALLVNIAKLSIDNLQKNPAGDHCAKIMRENIAVIEEFYNAAEG